LYQPTKEGLPFITIEEKQQKINSKNHLAGLEDELEKLQEKQQIKHFILRAFVLNDGRNIVVLI